MRSLFVSVIISISLLLSAGAASMWIRSYWRADTIVQYWASKTPSSGLVEWWSELDSNVGGLLLYHSVIRGRFEIAGLREAGKPDIGWSAKPASIYPVLEASTSLPSQHYSSTVHQGFGFALMLTAEAPRGYTGREVAIVLPWPAIVLFTTVPPILLLRHRRKKRGTAVSGASLCKHCGYSLIGNASGVCPECGTHIAAIAG